MKKLFLFVGIVTMLAMLLNGCQSDESEEDTTLKVALLPIMQTLPFYVAEKNGYFADEGIQVELLPVKSPTERDALMQANEIDGMLTDLPGIGVFNRDEPQVKIISLARKAYPNSPQFRLLTAPGSEITDPSGLANVKIGISQNTVIEYITDRMLEGSGLTPDQIAIEEITAIPVRFEQLMAGQIPAATLPDPLAQGAVAAGANLILDDGQFTQYSQSVLAFDTDAIDRKPKTLGKFLIAWNKAVSELNENPEAYQDLLIEKGRVPESIQGSFVMPPFPENEITGKEEWADVVAWLIEKGLISREIPYEDAIDNSFLE
jgi:NitT/TauT family transport system substrate-binding protein